VRWKRWCARRSNDQLASVTNERDTLEADLTAASDRADTAEAAIKKLAARAEVPDFTGARADDAEVNDTVGSLDWKIQTVTRETTPHRGKEAAAQAEGVDHPSSARGR